MPSICLFTVISAILCFVMVVFAQPIAVLMQSPEEALSMTEQYLAICGSGIFFIVAYNLLSAIFRGLGDSRSPLAFVGIACAVNVAGDLFFVAVVHMDVAGAAIATVLAQAISVIAALAMLKKKNTGISLRKENFGFNEETGRILRIGIPLALQDLLTQISFVIVCAFVNKLGLTASSGYGIACKLINFAMLLPSALMQSAKMEAVHSRRDEDLHSDRSDYRCCCLCPLLSEGRSALFDLHEQS